MSNEGSNTNSMFATAISELLSASNKLENVSQKLLQAVYENPAMFDGSFLKRYHTCNGKDKTGMLNRVLSDMYPAFAELESQADIKMGDVLPQHKSKMATVKADAIKKLRSIQNTLRNVFEADTFLVMGELKHVEGKEPLRITIESVEFKRTGKVTFARNYEGKVLQSEAHWSMADLIKMGKNTASELGWKPAKTSAGNVSAGKSVSETVRANAATGGFMPNAVKELCRSLKAILETRAFDTLEDSEQDAFAELERVLIKTVYAKEDGTVDCQLLWDSYDGEKAVIPTLKSKRAA